MRRARLTLAALTLTLGPLQAAASPRAQRFVSSGPVALVELFTSEGCSSCPPADEWLASLASDPGLWKRFVPVAFHVDYWDYLGWKDVFSQPAFSERHHDYGRAWRATAVYTPTVVRAGAIWGGWRGARSVPEQGGNAPRLALEIDERGHLRATTSSRRACLEVHVAPLALRSSSKVLEGENRGRMLEHAFAALGLVTLRLDRGVDGKAAATGMLPRGGIPADAVAAWLTECGDMAPLQAVGGALAR